MTAIFKSKFYIYQLTDDDRRIVRPELGAFETDTKAWDSMFQRAANQDPARPNCILMERKPEYKHHFTVSGERILKYPAVYERN